MLEPFLFQLLVGLYRASYYWLIASGLTLIFGVTRVINFSHAAFFALGGYLAYTFFTLTGSFWISVAASTLITGAVGLCAERALLRPLYKVEQIYQLLATFAITLIINDATKLVWGRLPLSTSMPSELKGGVYLLGGVFPTYYLFVIGLGLLVLVVLHVMLNTTMWGLRVKATWRDTNMAESLGINTQRVYASTFFLGTALAGLGGSFAVAVSPVVPGLGDNLIVTAFIVVVLAGLGNLVGAYVSSLMVGVAESVFTLLLPEVDILLIYAIMALVLVVRPWGLFGEK